MLSQKNCLEIKVENRVYQFHCACDSPLGEIHDALCQMKHFVVQKINEAQQAEKQCQNKTCDIAEAVNAN